MIHKIIRDDEAVIAVDGFPYIIPIDHPQYGEILDAIEDENKEVLLSLITTSGKRAKTTKNLLKWGLEEAAPGEWTCNGIPIAYDLSEYLEEAIDREDISPVANFIKKLMDNPNQDTRDRLFDFMQRNRHPIADDGRFLGYKIVDSNYMDKYTHTIDNRPDGVIPPLPWSHVDCRNDRACSSGYHICSKEYLSSFYFLRGDKVVSCLVSPEDVGAIPTDYNFSKIRCRHYTVVADITDKWLQENSDIKLRLDRGLNWGEEQGATEYPDWL